MSAHDGQRIAEALRASGYGDAPDPRDADVLVLTTCSVREKARQKVMSAIGRMRGLKARRGAQVIVVAGCVAQQEGQKLLDDADHVDVVVGPDHLWRIPALVEHVRATGERLCAVGFDDPAASTFLSLGAMAERPVSAFVTIQKGCDERCAFCIVPLVRGPGRCRPARDVVAEVSALAARGAREIVLLGQTVNSYRDGDTAFAGLLAAIDAVDGVERIRYESAHPRFLTAELIEAHATLRSLCEHVHLPVQSGSDAVLARMGRGHGRGDFLRWVSSLKDACPAVGISTDLFVGFPGESERDFEGTLSLVDEVGFDAAFTFKYSPRPETPAARWPDDVAPEVKAARLRRLQELQSRKTEQHLERLVGSTVEVLIEGESKAGGQLRGRSRRNTVINVDLPSEGAADRGERPVDGRALGGELVAVDIVQAGGHSVRGLMTSSPTRSCGGAGAAS
jgi:tRNA-2-methylthio-N6-dimethylallyladenosine synthase